MSPILVIAIAGIGTYLLRLSFIGLIGDRPVPAWAERPLRYVAPAVLAALVAPAVLLSQGSVVLSPAANPRFLAAVIAAVVAWRFRNVGLVIASGMVSLWILQAVL